MANSVAEELQQEMECEGLLASIYGLKQLDKECFRVIVESEKALTIDEVAEAVDRERSTAYRSIQRLLQSGFIRKEQINYDQGGYYHVYYPRDSTEITNDMQRTLNDWYAKMGQLIQEFEDKYDRAEEDTEIPAQN